MEYLYTVKEDFSFLASGNVIKHFSGMPCFPVRLNLELFERAYHLLNKDKITVYDPCCGSKELKIQTEQLRRIEKIRVGKRLIYLLENDRGCTPKTPPGDGSLHPTNST